MSQEDKAKAEQIRILFGIHNGEIRSLHNGYESQVKQMVEDRLINITSDNIPSLEPIGQAYVRVLLDCPLPQYKKVLTHPLTGAVIK